MKPIQDIAEVLVSSWVLTAKADEHEELDALPATQQGVLDRALEAAVTAGAFPADWRERLHFVDSRTGLQCVELDAVISAAQRALFTQDPNPSYSETRTKIDPRVARLLLRRYKIKDAQAIEWGEKLREAVAAARETMRAYARG